VIMRSYHKYLHYNTLHEPISCNLSTEAISGRRTFYDEM